MTDIEGAFKKMIKHLNSIKQKEKPNLRFIGAVLATSAEGRQ
jgi:hypothetical protein